MLEDIVNSESMKEEDGDTSHVYKQQKLSEEKVNSSAINDDEDDDEYDSINMVKKVEINHKSGIKSIGIENEKQIVQKLNGDIDRRMNEKILNMKLWRIYSKMRMSM